MANRLEYNIIGRYADGREITAYHLQGINNDKSVKLTREQVVYLVGRGQIRNCEAQIYKDKVLLRGIGVDLAKLPTKVENIRGDKSNATGNKFRLVNSLVNGTSTIGYTVMNSEGKTARLPRDKVIELAKADMVENVKYITANGKSGLTGTNGFRIRDLESINMNDKGENQANKVNKTEGNEAQAAKGVEENRVVKSNEDKRGNNIAKVIVQAMELMNRQGRYKIFNSIQIRDRNNLESGEVCAVDYALTNKKTDGIFGGYISILKSGNSYGVMNNIWLSPFDEEDPESMMYGEWSKDVLRKIIKDIANKAMGVYRSNPGLVVRNKLVG